MATAKVASIFWDALSAQKLYPGGPFILPAVELDAPPAILEVRDQMQSDRLETGPDGKRKLFKHPVTARSIALDLVYTWAGNGLEMSTDCHPGVWYVRELLPEVNPDGTLIRDADGIGLFREATPQEKAAMWAEDEESNRNAQREYAQRMFDKGEAMYNEEPRRRPFIPVHAFGGAKYYGIEGEWLKKASERQMKTCPSCTKVIAQKALKCPHCSEVVDIEGYAKRAALIEAAVRTEKDALRKTA